jgi:ubiquinone biosynthesis accessory factor UbiJ
MLHSLQAPLEALVTSALAERLTLLFNHVLSSEPVATQRLLPHSQRVLQVELLNWPSLLPRPPVLSWRISPAGLLEWVGAAPAVVATETVHATGVSAAASGACASTPDLTVRLDASNPAALLAQGLLGHVPPVQVEGDAQLASDVNWIIQNVRWDVAGDLERLFGPGLAQPLQRAGAAAAEGLRKAVAGAQGFGERLRAWRA